MWGCAVITIEIGLVDGDIMIIEVTTPVGMVQIIGKVARVGRLLHVSGAHVEGYAAARLDVPASMP
jgi:hypothetical protein